MMEHWSTSRSWIALRSLLRRNGHSGALDLLESCLSRLDSAVCVFFRDDDVAKPSSSLVSLLEVFSEAGVPLHLAVIPGQCRQKSANQLVDLTGQCGCPIEFGQHGWQHTNHGGYAEFGKMRSLPEQLADMSSGKRAMSEMFGESSCDVFSPPYNHYDLNTVACAAALGFRGFVTWSGQPFSLRRSRLRQIVLNCDFMAQYLPCPVVQRAGSLSSEICDRLAEDGYLGLMLHHEMLGRRDRRLLAGLLELFAKSPLVRLRPLSKSLN